MSISSCLAATAGSRASSVSFPEAAARRPPARARAALATAPRSGFAAVGEGNRSTAAVPVTAASHQPASRSGIIALVPGEAAART